MDFKQYEDYFVQTTTSILVIDSPTGFTTKVTEYICKIAAGLGIDC